MAKHILMIAFHFPPHRGSSGLLRTVKFAKYLPEFGWHPTILTVHPRAYDELNHGDDPDVLDGVEIVRAFALDAKKHLSIVSRYPRWLALPDRWASWSLGAIPAGLRLAAESKIDVVYSTYPIATAVLIGLALRKLTGLPWLADFRDPMTEEHYPPDPMTRRIHRWIEGNVARHASRTVFTTESTRRMFEASHAKRLVARTTVIPNGFDDEDFRGVTPACPASTVQRGPLRLVHTGLVCPGERDPGPLFRALRRLQDLGEIRPQHLRIELRGCGADTLCRKMIDDLEIGDLVRVLTPLPYRDSLRHAATADALLVLQGASCDRQIPAKVYEYLRINRPILALTTHRGDTASLLRDTGGATVANLDDEDDIVRVLPRFLARVAAHVHALPDASIVGRYTRRCQAERLAICLDELVRERDARRRTRSGRAPYPAGGSGRCIG